MGLPPLFYDGRDNPPHPEAWIKCFLRMMELYAKNAVEISVKTRDVRFAHSLVQGVLEC